MTTGYTDDNSRLSAIRDLTADRHFTIIPGLLLWAGVSGDHGKG